MRRAALSLTMIATGVLAACGETPAPPAPQNTQPQASSLQNTQPQSMAEHTASPRSALAQSSVALSETAMLAAACSSCHQAGGRALVSLEGYDAPTLAAALRAYQTEAGTTVMHRLARGYSDAQIEAIAVYLEPYLEPSAADAP